MIILSVMTHIYRGEYVVYVVVAYAQCYIDVYFACPETVE